MELTVLKRKQGKTSRTEAFDTEKIVAAINKSAMRTIYRKFNPDETAAILDIVMKNIKLAGEEKIPVEMLHSYVEGALMQVNPKVASSYIGYRDRRLQFLKDQEEDEAKINSIYYRGDKENSNADSALVSTQRSLSYNVVNTTMYKKSFLNNEELQAVNYGYIYCHDMSARRDTMNCCLYDVESVLTGGFEMGNIWYNEPKTLDVAFDVIGDIILSASSQQYGGFTVPEISKILSKYAIRSFNKYIEKYTRMGVANAEKYAWEDVEEEARQGFQGFEYKLNTVASSRGDYPFTTFTGGIEIDPDPEIQKARQMLWKTCLEVRMAGQGKKNNKKPVLFPKLVFTYDENLHGEGKELEWLFEIGVECSQRCMYPDWLSMSGEGYIASMYKKYGKIISPMGCRAFLSPWYERGGMYPADEEDIPRFVGRFNIGAISLNLPMILQKSREEGMNFYECLDYYMEMIRSIHIRTYEYLGERKASTNPLAYCEGGFYGGNLQPWQSLKESPTLLPAATASFGITALNELQQLYNGKSLYEDGEFALEVLKYINEKIDYFKKEDGHLYAIYGTPAENLCGLQVKQFRTKYGIIKNVSDREYVSNSFHCHVTEDISPIEKQDSEYRFWELCNGGKIQYVRYHLSYNKDVFKTLLRRAMKMGFYEGVNLSLAYCDDCGHQELEMDVCPKCGSKNLTKIDRMNGYLSYSRVHGDTRLNEAKMAEIAERKSM